jgi:putative flippase GtrA
MSVFSPKTLLILRYGITGVFGACVQVVVLWIGVSVLGYKDQYLIVVAVGFLTALAITFPLQKYWTFQDGTYDRATRQLFWYTAIALCSLGANTFLLTFARRVIESYHGDFFRLWYLIAEMVILVFVAGMSFVFNRAFTFRALNTIEK